MPMAAQDYSVQFGTSVDMGMGPQKTFPFLYGFIHKRDDTWVPTTDLDDNLNGLGVTVAAGTTVEHPVILDPDYNFKMLYFKYAVYHHDEANGYYEWYEDVPNPLAVVWEYDLFDQQTSYGDPLVRNIDVSLYVGTSNQYIYGGANNDIRPTSTAALVPLPIETIQGYEYGFGMPKIPYLLPKNGQLIFKITNNHATKSMVVTGLVHGVKVRL